MLAVWATCNIIGTPIFTAINADSALVVNGAPQPVGYINNAYWMCGLPAIAFVALLFLNVRERDRSLRFAHGGTRVRAWCLVARCTCKVLGLTAQEEEWALYEQELTAKAAAAGAGAGATKDIEGGSGGTGESGDATPAPGSPALYTLENPVAVPTAGIAKALTIAGPVPASSADDSAGSVELSAAAVASPPHAPASQPQHTHV
jgi:hypothetical protein